MARNILGAELPTGVSESRGEAAADGDRIAVAPRVVVRALDRVGERVPVVENLAQASLGQVSGDDAGLDGDRAGGDLRELRAV